MTKTIEQAGAELLEAARKYSALHKAHYAACEAERTRPGTTWELAEQFKHRSRFQAWLPKFPVACTVCDDHGRERNDEGVMHACRNCCCSNCGAQVGPLQLTARKCMQCDLRGCSSCGRSFPAAELHPMNDYCGDCFVPGYLPGMAAEAARRELRDLMNAVHVSGGRPSRTLELAMLSARLVLDGKGA